jgi:hypothetical protein
MTVSDYRSGSTATPIENTCGQLRWCGMDDARRSELKYTRFPAFKQAKSRKVDFT